MAADVKRRWSVVPLVAAIGIYQKLVSPALGTHCRFSPSCSRYAVEALELHGLVRGAAMAGRRLARCQPMFEGGYDPVPRERGAAPC
jgi:uncharacterized protein